MLTCMKFASLDEVALGIWVYSLRKEFAPRGAPFIKDKNKDLSFMAF